MPDRPLVLPPEVEPKYSPREFLTVLFCELSGLVEHRERYRTNPDSAISAQGHRLYTAKIKEALWIIGEYTGWGELKAQDEYDKWQEVNS
jgi:hypothetical protein